MIDYDEWGEKPLPAIDPESEPYWEAAADERLVVQQCRDCGEYQFYPRSVCRNCHSTDVSLDEHSGEGTVYSYTICHVAGKPGYEDDVPYNFALVDLDLPAENPSGRPVRMPTHVVDVPDEQLAVGLSVEVAFVRVSDDPEIRLPVFRPDVS